MSKNYIYTLVIFNLVYNIGGEEQITIVELAKKIIGITNSKSTIEFIPYEKVFTADFEDMQRRVPSTKKIYDCIKWESSFNIDEILSMIYSSQKKELTLEN